MHILKFLLISSSLFVSSLAHHGPHPRASKTDLTRRAKLGHQCSQHVAQFNEKRWNQGLNKRSDPTGTFQLRTEGPYYDKIHNDTCVLAADTTTGPYIWPRSQTLRQDMSEDQQGIPLWLDIGVMDMATCSPLEGVLVDLWHCNATGSYSSFTGIPADKTFGEYTKENNIKNVKFGVTDLHTDNTTFCRGMWPTDENGMTELKTIFPGMFKFTAFPYARCV